MSQLVRIQRSRSKSRTFRRQLSGIQDLLKMFIIEPIEKQRRMELQDAKLSKLQQDRKIGELEEGIKANKLVLLDIQIEQKKLELLALKRKLGDPDSFAPPSED